MDNRHLVDIQGCCPGLWEVENLKLNSLWRVWPATPCLEGKYMSTVTVLTGSPFYTHLTAWAYLYKFSFSTCAAVSTACQPCTRSLRSHRRNYVGAFPWLCGISTLRELNFQFGKVSTRLIVYIMFIITGRYLDLHKTKRFSLLIGVSAQCWYENLS